MKPRTLLERLGELFPRARACDDEAVAGVYAVPGPRAQGDESAAPPPALAAALLDPLRVSQLPDPPPDLAVAITRARGEDEGGGGGGGDPAN